MTKLTNYLSIIIVLFGFCNNTFSQTLVTHDFNNGNLRPYETRKADQRTRVKVTKGAVETRWEQRKYNGTNSGRKAQFMPIGDPKFKQHIWMGLSLKIHSDYMKDNTNTNAGLMQIWGFDGKSGKGNHMCMLKFDGRKGGALVWQHRFNSVKNKAHYLIQSNFPRNKFVDIVIHVQLKNRNQGTVKVWVDGKLKLNKKNQTIGWGDMGPNGMINGTYAGGTSLGQYNFMEKASLDDAYDGKNIAFDGHRRGETRTVTYDNVSLYSGANGFDRVNPDKGNTPPSDGNTVHIRKSNASNFAIDGGKGGANGQNIYLSSSNSSNKNQQWNEINRGNGFYSYQKRGTNFCIDGGNGGTNRQNVYLWTCAKNNQNQHWKKVSTGSGNFKLIKRNAPYAIDGGNKGANRQNIALYNASNRSQNLQWRITPVNNVNKTISLDNRTQKIEGLALYPNPVTDILNIEFKGEEATFSVINLIGQKVHSGIIKKGNNTIALDNLDKGVYIIKINHEGETLIKRIMND